MEADPAPCRSMACEMKPFWFSLESPMELYVSVGFIITSNYEI